MHERIRIFGGLVLFIALAAFPVWYARATGRANVVPEPKLVNAGRSA